MSLRLGAGSPEYTVLGDCALFAASGELRIWDWGWTGCGNGWRYDGKEELLKAVQLCCISLDLEQASSKGKGRNCFLLLLTISRLGFFRL